VVIKLIPLIIDAALAKCREKIAQSIDLLLCPKLDRGGYTVHPHPALPPIKVAKRIMIREGAINQ
jgi:hypothetical protein